MINSNVMPNTIWFYHYPSGDIDYLLVFFGPEFKVNFDSPLQKLTIKVPINISFKYYDSNIVVVFGTQDNIQSR